MPHSPCCKCVPYIWVKCEALKVGLYHILYFLNHLSPLRKKMFPNPGKKKGTFFIDYLYCARTILSHLILAATLMEMMIISISQVVKLRVHKDEVFFSISWEFRVEPMSHSNAHFLPSVLSWLSVAFQISSLPPLCTCKLIYPYFMQSNSHFDKMI